MIKLYVKIFLIAVFSSFAVFSPSLAMDDQPEEIDPTKKPPHLTRRNAFIMIKTADGKHNFTGLTLTEEECEALLQIMKTPRSPNASDDDTPSTSDGNNN